MSHRSVHVLGMMGLGDNLYMRPYVHALRRQVDELYLSTPWPELYDGLDVLFVKPATRLRTQAKNLTRTDAVWSTPPAGVRTIRVGYSANDMRTGSIQTALKRVFGVPGAHVIPLLGLPASPVTVDKPVAVIRPVTVRREWLNPARNPKPQYIHDAAYELAEAGYHVVSVADIVQGLEWIDGREPFAHQRFHKGELNVRQLMALVAHASVVVGGVGWIVPAALTTRVPTFIVYGGNGGNNGPSKILPESLPANIAWAAPNPLCGCASSTHSCNKEIHAFDRKFAEWLARPDVRSNRRHFDVLVA